MRQLIYRASNRRPSRSSSACPPPVTPPCRDRRRDGLVRDDPDRRGDGSGHRQLGGDDAGCRLLPLRIEGADPRRGDGAVPRSTPRRDARPASRARRHRRAELADHPLGVVGRTAPRSGDRVLRQLDRAQPAGRSAPSRDASGDDRAAAGRRAVGPLAVESAPKRGSSPWRWYRCWKRRSPRCSTRTSVYRGLGAKKFVAEVAAIANRIAGMD